MADTEMDEIAQAKRDLTDAEQTQFELQYSRMRKNPTTALILGLLFGTIGVDRLYIGDIGLGIAKLLTLGGLLIWALIDLFLIMGAARARNTDAIHSIKASILAARP